MQQRSPEWFEARKNRITASIVGAILGNSPYMTRDDAMRVMVRESLGAEREFIGNVATEYGTANEENALIDYRLTTLHDIETVGFMTREGEDWCGVSPDGLIGERGGIEAKCPYSLRNDESPAFKPLDDQPHYYDQVQFTLWVTQRAWWHFWQWAPGGEKLEVVKPDIDWQNDALPQLRQFYAEFLHERDNNPDEYLALKRVIIDTPEAHKMVGEWDDIAEQMELLAERKKDLLDSMKILAGGRDADFAGRKLTQVERAGAVSYAKVVKDHCADIDLEPYRGKPSRYWKLT